LFTAHFHHIVKFKSAHSFNADLSLEFDQPFSINISSILIGAAAKVTHSGQLLIIAPDSFDKITIQTAEFNVNLADQKQKSSIIDSLEELP